MIEAFLAKAAAFGLTHWRAVALAVLIAFAGAQTVRLSHAKHDLTAARAAQINPATHKLWKVEAERDGRDLKICRANGDTLQAIIARQTAAATTLQAVSDQKMAVATKAAADARAVAASAREASAALSARELLGATPCARADDAQRAFLEKVK
jgi:hypothetical protein